MRTTVCLIAMLLAMSSAAAEEKLVGRDGKILYYLKDDGRVVRPDGSVAGYMKPDRSFVKPNGEKRFDLRSNGTRGKGDEHGDD